jgi:hypothetical protein
MQVMHHRLISLPSGEVPPMPAQMMVAASHAAHALGMARLALPAPGMAMQTSIRHALSCYPLPLHL